MVKRFRLFVVPMLGLAFLLVPAQGPGADDGLGRVVVTPDHVTAGSTNTFTLVFTADTGALEGQTLIDVPRGWSAPQVTRAGQTGYVAIAPGACATAKVSRLVGQRLVIATSCDRGQSFTVTYGPATASTLAADGYVFLTQTKPNVGITKTKLVPVKKVVKDKRGRKHTKLTKKRVSYVVKPAFHPLAQKKEPVVVVTGGQFHHLIVNAPTIVTAGTPFSITVRAEDVYGNTAIGYGSTVSFTSSDPDAFLPQPYRFQSTDLGAKSFGGVILRAPGSQSITVSDDAGHSDVSNPISVYSFFAQ
jgi:NPCBM-associated, NEW3 domain of alpha-galactosidase